MLSSNAIAYGIGGEYDERDPDEPESQHLSVAKRLVKGEDAEEKGAARREILEKPTVVRRRWRAAWANQRSGRPVTIPGPDQEQI